MSVQTGEAPLLSPEFLRSHFDAGLPYDRYAATGNPHQQASWKEIYDRARLTEAQRALVASWTRDMPVLVSSGVWCGDCVQQCPLLARIAEANPARVRVRFVDRDAHKSLAERVMICGGLRVPTAIFMAEDFAFVSLLGDRTLARYRAVAARQLGASCPVPGAPIESDELAATLQDWLDEFERVQLVLRLSARLRQKHGD
jgi:thiol-disulfide isomerase/thioredoxin